MSISCQEFSNFSQYGLPDGFDRVFLARYNETNKLFDKS